MRIRVINISRSKSHGGQFLSMGERFKDALIPADRYWQGEVGTEIPEHVLEWRDQGLCRVINADSGVDIGAPAAQMLTPGQLSPLREMRGADAGLKEKETRATNDDPFEEDEPDLNLAVDATLPPLQSVPGAALGMDRPGRPPGPGEAEGAHMPERPGQPARRPAIAPHHVHDRVRVSESAAKVDTSRVDTNNELSPIPGEVPHSLDNSAAFTIRAPRHTGPGAVISSKR